MFGPSRTRFLLVVLGVGALDPAPASSDPPTTLTVGACQSCWPLTSTHPGSILIPDGAGGVFITWTDAGPHVRLQRVNPDLTLPAGWPAGGLLIGADLAARQIWPSLASDGAGGLYVAWVEQDPVLDTQVRLLRVRSDGSPETGWPASGVVLSRPNQYVEYPVVTARGNRGAAVAWIGSGPSGREVRLQMVDSRGRIAPAWPSGGSLLGSGDWYNNIVGLISDQRGGVHLLWTENREIRSDVRISIVSERGQVKLPGRRLATDAVPVDATMEQSHPEIAPDGSGGAFVVWTDVTHGELNRAIDLTDVFAQHVSATGEIASGWTRWAASGRPIAAGSWYQLNPRVTADGSGGAFVAWSEQGPGILEVGRVVRLDGTGEVAPGWPTEGLALGNVAPTLVADGSGSAFLMWNDGTEAYVQRLGGDSRPTAGWTAPMAIGSARGKGNPLLALDGKQGAFVAWEEHSGQRRAVVLRHLSGAGAEVATPGPASGPAPLAFTVHAAAPNPARTRCRIRFDLPARASIDIELFDIAGRRVDFLARHRMFEAGARFVEWDLNDRQGRPAPAGLYFARVTTGVDQAVVRITVVR